MCHRVFLRVLLVVFLMTGPVSAQPSSDPLEPVNRVVHTVNEGIDAMLFKPLAQGYTFITPAFVQKGVNNAFDNFFYPNVIINQFLQGKFKLGVQDFGRFFLNSSLGLGGLIDVAVHGGLTKHNEDFGQTLGHWGAASGPYIVLPLFGPSTLRDSLGRVADSFASPLYHIEDDETKYGLLGLSIIDTRAELLDAEELVSGDEYLFVRDAYLQRRSFMIKDGKMEEYDPFLDDE